MAPPCDAALKVDVMSLREAGLGSSYRPVHDTGTLHDLTDDQRVAMNREVSDPHGHECDHIAKVAP
jgi:hypothetical protein